MYILVRYKLNKKNYSFFSVFFGLVVELFKIKYKNLHSWARKTFFASRQRKRDNATT